jgi:hypothetical protein
MHLRLFVALAFGAVAAAYGQSAAPITIALDQSDSARPGFKVKNTAAVTVTAFVASFDLPAPPGPKRVKLVGRKLYDAATEPLAAKPIAPNQEVSSPLYFGKMGPRPEVKLEAVLFADGTSWGDPAWIRRILLRRKYMEKSLKTSIAELADAAIRGAARDEVIGGFQSSLDSEQAAAAGPDEQVCIRSVRGVVLRNLRQVTQKPDGTQIPTKEVLLRQIDSLRIRLTALQKGGSGL